MAEKRATLLLRLKDQASKGLRGVGTSLDRLSKKFDRSKFVFAAIGGAIGAAGILALKAAGDFEQWRISFTTMLGSAERADILLKKIKQFAKETPFDLPQVIKGGRALLAFGIEASKIIPTMKSLGDVSAGLGVPMERLILNFGQVKAQAKLTGRELRDFAVAGVPLLAVLAKNLNVTEAEIQEMVSRGKVGFKEVEEAFQSMSGASGRFANLMSKQMDSLQGKFSNVQDTVFQLSASFGNIFLPQVKKATDFIITLGDKLNDLDKATKKNIVVIAAFITGTAGMIAGLGALVAISGPLIVAFSLLFTVIAPIVAIIGIVGFTVLALKDDFVTLGNFAIEVFDKIKEKILGFFETIKETFSILIPDVIKEAFDRMFETVSEFGENTKETFGVLVNDVKKRFTDMKKNAAKNFSDILKSLKKMIIESLKLKKIEAGKEKDFKDLSAKEDEERESKLAAFRKLLNSERVKNFESVLGQISSLSISKNRELAFIGKAAAISLATINTLRGMTLALATIPPPFGFVAAAAVGAAGFAQVARITGVQLAHGGIVQPRVGGTVATLAEAGQAEAVIPLEEDGVGLGGITINVGVLLGTEDNIKDLAVLIDEELFALRRNNESQAFDTVGSSI